MNTGLCDVLYIVCFPVAKLQVVNCEADLGVTGSRPLENGTKFVDLFSAEINWKGFVQKL